MKRLKAAWRLLIAFAALPLLLGGCGSSPQVRHYTLSPVKVQPTTPQATSSVEGHVIAIGPIGIPEYLERPEIVMRNTQNELTLGEFDRWGGTLRNDIEVVLLENLSALLAPDGISVLSWKRSVAGALRVPVDITRFDAAPGDSVLLKAQWSIMPKLEKTPLLIRESTLSEPVNGRDYTAVVVAMSEALGRLSQEIANSVRLVSSMWSPEKQGPQ